jgi:hypothetical protein
VNPLGVERQRDIHPIIDQERRARRPRPRQQSLGQTIQVQRGEILLPELNGTDPARQRPVHDLEQVAVQGLGAVRDQI